MKVVYYLECGDGLWALIYVKTHQILHLQYMCSLLHMNDTLTKLEKKVTSPVRQVLSSLCPHVQSPKPH